MTLRGTAITPAEEEGVPAAERVDPGANPDYKQVFGMGYESPAEDPLAVHGLKYYAPNVLPDDLPEFRQAPDRYYAAAPKVAMEVLSAVAEALGRPAQSFDAAFDRPMALLRGNFYPERPAWAGARDFGIAPHTDYGCLTLLATDGRPGLEVQGRNGAWTPLCAAPGELVVNFGEMLEMWTAGQVRATPHRVIGGREERISVPLFFNPNYDTDVSPPRAPRPILAGAHLSRRYDETYLHLSDTAGR